jgi:hypothetical protein
MFRPSRQLACLLPDYGDDYEAGICCVNELIMAGGDTNHHVRVPMRIDRNI